MKLKLSIQLTALLALWAAPAAADWLQGEPYKMHYPQLPDPNGWDVNLTGPWVVADDWLCTSTGPVTDIHFWYSWQGNVVKEITGVTATIWSDVPVGDPLNPFPYSHPGDLLWGRTFLPEQFTIAGPEIGAQGWLEPTGVYVKPDHTQYYQLNIENILTPFEQQKGTIYWLGLQVLASDEGKVGWKTSLDAWNDDAVWAVDPQAGNWEELIDPITHQSLNMAFVITGAVPEPGTVVMLIGLGMMGAVVYGRRRRS